MNNDEVEKNIITAIEILGKVVTSNFKIVNERITEIMEENEVNWKLIHSFVEGIKEHAKPKAEIPEVVITQEGHAIKKPDAKKIPADGLGKLPEGYKIHVVGCTYCQGLIAWPKFIPDSKLGPGEKRKGPLHCDLNGNIKGDGRCPKL